MIALTSHLLYLNVLQHAVHCLTLGCSRGEKGNLHHEAVMISRHMVMKVMNIIMYRKHNSKIKIRIIMIFMMKMRSSSCWLNDTVSSVFAAKIHFTPNYLTHCGKVLRQQANNFHTILVHPGIARINNSRMLKIPELFGPFWYY